MHARLPGRDLNRLWGRKTLNPTFKDPSAEGARGSSKQICKFRVPTLRDSDRRNWCRLTTVEDHGNRPRTPEPYALQNPHHRSKPHRTFRSVPLGVFTDLYKCSEANMYLLCVFACFLDFHVDITSVIKGQCGNGLCGTSSHLQTTAADGWRVGWPAWVSADQDLGF